MNCKPKQIILVRHGQSIGNLDKSVYAHTPDFKLHLTGKGQEQIEKSGNIIKGLIGESKVYFYVSPFKRTRETYNIIKNQFDLNYIIGTREDPRIREQEWGHRIDNVLDYQKIQDFRDSYSTFYYRFPDGESCADVYDRVSSFLDTFYRDMHKFVHDAPVIVTHGMAMRVFIMRWFHWTVERFEQERNPYNGDLYIMRLNHHNKYDLFRYSLEENKETQVFHHM